MSELEGPKREVVYIFEREGKQGGGFWMLVLACGHAVSRTRPPLSTGRPYLLLRRIHTQLAPKRVQCHYCGSGSEKCDPWIMIKALNGGADPGSSSTGGDAP